MSWESRNGSGRYYTQSRRRNGKVERVYWGNGETARLIAQLDEIEREGRIVKRIERHVIRDEASELDRIMADICRGVDRVARTALLAAGYHQHKRGEWRKRRVARRENE